MKSYPSDVVGIFILIFLAGFLAALLFFRFILIPNSSEYKVISNQVSEREHFEGKKQKLSINGYNLKTTTVCFNGTEMMFAFYVDDMEIVNLNKPCGEIK
jgi:hypothetical protein|nr:MAG TPA: hypothetical protein [Bacteriophage sp.]